MHINLFILFVGIIFMRFASADHQWEPANGSSSPLSLTESHCNISVSNPYIDYGSQSRWQMQSLAGDSQLVTPGKRQLLVNIICPYSQVIKVRISGAATGQGDFLYGDTGSLQVNLVSAQIDGQNALVALSASDSHLKTTPVSSLQIKPGQVLTGASSGHAAQGKLFTMQLEISPVMTEQGTRVSSRQVNQSDIKFELID